MVEGEVSHITVYLTVPDVECLVLTSCFSLVASVNKIQN